LRIIPPAPADRFALTDAQGTRKHGAGFQP
jgi:hypothetical protein